MGNFIIDYFIKESENMNQDKRYDEIIKNELSDVKNIIKKGDINFLYEDLKGGGIKTFIKILFLK